MVVHQKHDQPSLVLFYAPNWICKKPAAPEEKQPIGDRRRDSRGVNRFLVHSASPPIAGIGLALTRYPELQEQKPWCNLIQKYPPLIFQS